MMSRDGLPDEHGWMRLSAQQQEGSAALWSYHNTKEKRRKKRLKNVKSTISNELHPVIAKRMRERARQQRRARAKAKRNLEAAAAHETEQKHAHAQNAPFGSYDDGHDSGGGGEGEEDQYSQSHRHLARQGRQQQHGGGHRHHNKGMPRSFSHDVFETHDGGGRPNKFSVRQIHDAYAGKHHTKHNKLPTQQQHAMNFSDPQELESMLAHVVRGNPYDVEELIGGGPAPSLSPTRSHHSHHSHRSDHSHHSQHSQRSGLPSLGASSHTSSQPQHSSGKKDKSKKHQASPGAGHIMPRIGGGDGGSRLPQPKRLLFGGDHRGHRDTDAQIERSTETDDVAAFVRKDDRTGRGEEDEDEDGGGASALDLFDDMRGAREAELNKAKRGQMLRSESAPGEVSAAASPAGQPSGEAAHENRAHPPGGAGKRKKKRKKNGSGQRQRSRIPRRNTDDPVLPIHPQLQAPQAKGARRSRNRNRNRHTREDQKENTEPPSQQRRHVFGMSANGRKDVLAPGVLAEAGRRRKPQRKRDHAAKDVSPPHQQQQRQQQNSLSPPKDNSNRPPNKKGRKQQKARVKVAKQALSINSGLDELRNERSAALALLEEIGGAVDADFNEWGIKSQVTQAPDFEYVPAAGGYRGPILRALGQSPSARISLGEHTLNTKAATVRLGNATGVDEAAEAELRTMVDTQVLNGSPLQSRPVEHYQLEQVAEEEEGGGEQRRAFPFEKTFESAEAAILEMIAGDKAARNEDKGEFEAIHRATEKAQDSAVEGMIHELKELQEKELREREARERAEAEALHAQQKADREALAREAAEAAKKRAEDELAALRKSVELHETEQAALEDQNRKREAEEAAIAARARAEAGARAQAEAQAQAEAALRIQVTVRRWLSAVSVGRLRGDSLARAARSDAAVLLQSLARKRRAAMDVETARLQRNEQIRAAEAAAAAAAAAEEEERRKAQAAAEAEAAAVLAAKIKAEEEERARLQVKAAAATTVQSAARRRQAAGETAKLREAKRRDVEAQQNAAARTIQCRARQRSARSKSADRRLMRLAEADDKLKAAEEDGGYSDDEEFDEEEVADEESSTEEAPIEEDEVVAGDAGATDAFAESKLVSRHDQTSNATAPLAAASENGTLAAAAGPASIAAACDAFLAGSCAAGNQCPFLHGSPDLAAATSAAPTTSASEEAEELEELEAEDLEEEIVEEEESAEESREEEAEGYGDDSFDDDDDGGEHSVQFRHRDGSASRITA